MFDKYIQVIPVLSESLVTDILAYASAQPQWTQATVFSHDGSVSLNSDRTCQQVWLNSNFDRFTELVDAMNKGVEQYTENVLRQIPVEQLRMPMPCSYLSKSHLENIGVVRYSSGQEYKWHADVGFASTDDYSNRTISVVLYLTDDFEGGGTEFIDGTRKPKAGEAIYFPSSWTFYHRAQPVTKGTKYVIITWYHVYQ